MQRAGRLLWVVLDDERSGPGRSCATGSATCRLPAGSGYGGVGCPQGFAFELENANVCDAGVDVSCVQPDKCSPWRGSRYQPPGELVELHVMEHVRLIYTSVARGVEPTFDELASILRQANANNARAGLTGILCYARGKFLQALEGERSVVNRVYRKIAQDSRHHDCEILSFTAIDTHRFVDWSMRLVAMDLPPNVELTQMTPLAAEEYLNECAERERRRAA